MSKNNNNNLMINKLKVENVSYCSVSVYVCVCAFQREMERDSEKCIE